MSDERFHPPSPNGDRGTPNSGQPSPEQSEPAGGPSQGQPAPGHSYGGVSASSGPTGQYPGAPSGQSAPSGPSGQYPGAPSGQTSQYPQQYPPNSAPLGYSGASAGSPHTGQYPQRQERGRTVAIISILVVLVLVLVGLGIWWWTSKSSSPESVPGEDSPDAAMTTFVERVNSDDLLAMHESVSPAEKQYTSAILSLMVQYTIGSTGTSMGDSQEALDIIDEYSDELNESMSLSMEVGESTSTEMAEEITVITVTDGYFAVTIDDPELFAQTIDSIAQDISDKEQYESLVKRVTENTEYETFEEAVLGAAEEINESGTFEFSDEPVPFAFVSEENGWYVSPMSSAVANAGKNYFLDESYRAAIEQQGGKFEMPEMKSFDSPEEAGRAFLEEGVTGNVKDLPGYLPLAEARAAALGWYLSGPTRLGFPQQFSDVFRISDVSLTGVEVSDRSTILVMDSFIIRLHPALAGPGAEYRMEDGQIMLPQCPPVDASILTDEEGALLALAAIKDDAGWHVSIGGTFLNAAGVLGANSELQEDADEVIQELTMCGK